jgi:uncharacterized protein YjiS (DUF1127 family)
MECIMSDRIFAKAARASNKRPSLSYQSLRVTVVRFFRSSCVVGTWRSRYRQRKELLNFLATDHRAAADIGITRYDATQWLDRPFWRN